MGQNGPKSGENLRFLLKFGQKITKNGPKWAKIWRKFEIFTKIWPKNDENFEIFGKIWPKINKN